MGMSGENVRDAILKSGKEVSKKTAETIVSQGDAVKAASEKIAETVVEEGSTKAEDLAFFLGNLTKNVQDSSKGAVTVHSGKRAAGSGFKAAVDYSRGDPICGTLCVISSGCEVVSGVIVWFPFPGKICTVSALKAVSVGCEKIRDMCATNPKAPGC
jgi:hypothetical protein